MLDWLLKFWLWFSSIKDSFTLPVNPVAGIFDYQKTQEIEAMQQTSFWLLYFKIGSVVKCYTLL